MAEFSEILARAPLYDGSHSVEMWVRCRKCAACLAQRRKLWAARALKETAVAPRTWFGTFTLNPDAHFLMECRAGVRLHEGGTDWGSLNAPEQFLERHREIAKELSLYLKRVRKYSEAKLRYLLVAEAHKSGLPHYHMLIHERLTPVRKQLLKDQWKLGFTDFKLVDDPRQAAYVCKYLGKSALARIRASQDYGLAKTLSSQGGFSPPLKVNGTF